MPKEEKNIQWLLSPSRHKVDITKVRGITKRLKRAFYSHAKLFKGTSTVGHGTRIHRQLYHYIECNRDGKCHCTVKHRGYHISVRNAVKHLLENDLKPVAAEVPVLCKTGGLGTALDMVCEWGGRGHAVISVKTGGCNEWKDGDFFKPPLDNIPLTPRNINQLQR